MSREQLARVQQEEGPELAEAQEGVSQEKVAELAASKESALQELGQRSTEESTTIGNSLAQSAEGLGGTPEEVAAATGQVQELEQQKGEVIRLARERIAGLAGAETAVDVAQPTSESLATQGAEAANDNDPEALAKEQEGKVHSVIEQVSGLSGEEARAFVAEYNKTNPNSLKGEEMRLIRADGEKMFVVNEQGSLEELSVTKENAREVLLGIKAKDEVLKGKSYELRKAILERSEGRGVCKSSSALRAPW